MQAQTARPASPYQPSVGAAKHHQTSRTAGNPIPAPYNPLGQQPSRAAQYHPQPQAPTKYDNFWSALELNGHISPAAGGDVWGADDDFAPWEVHPHLVCLPLLSECSWLAWSAKRFCFQDENSEDEAAFDPFAKSNIKVPTWGTPPAAAALKSTHISPAATPPSACCTVRAEMVTTTRAPAPGHS